MEGRDFIARPLKSRREPRDKAGSAPPRRPISTGCRLRESRSSPEILGLPSGPILATLLCVTIQVNLPDELVARIDSVTQDRAAFVVEAIRNLLRESEPAFNADETARIDEVADELNREAEDVLEYQVIP
jgi:hypothetical protein